MKDPPCDEISLLDEADDDSQSDDHSAVEWMILNSIHTYCKFIGT